MVDFRNQANVENMETLISQLQATGMQLVEQENIGPNVIKSIEAEDASKKARIEKLVPPKWQKLFSEFAGVVGSSFYNTLKEDSRKYYRFVLRKAA